MEVDTQWELAFHRASRRNLPRAYCAVTQQLSAPEVFYDFKSCGLSRTSWYVPAFGVKQDAIPGFVRDTWFKAEKVGTFRGFCTELCGKEHAFMPVVVEVLSGWR